MGKQGTSEAERRARGLRRVVVWLPVEHVARLDRLCEESGHSRAEHVQAWIDCEEAELAELKR